MAYQWLVDVFPDSVHRPEALFQAAEVMLAWETSVVRPTSISRYLQEQPEGAHRGEVLIGLGTVQRDLGNPAEALRQWRSVWVDHPEDPAAAKVPDLEQTLPPSFMVPAIAPEDLYRRAQRLYRLNRHREALQAFALARAAAPNQPLSAETLYQIGTSQYHARDNTAALATFQIIYADRSPWGAGASGASHARAIVLTDRRPTRIFCAPPVHSWRGFQTANKPMKSATSPGTFIGIVDERRRQCAPINRPSIVERPQSMPTTPGGILAGFNMA